MFHDWRQQVWTLVSDCASVTTPLTGRATPFFRSFPAAYALAQASGPYSALIGSSPPSPGPCPSSGCGWIGWEDASGSEGSPLILVTFS